jgi:hypothetical protein
MARIWHGAGAKVIGDDRIIVRADERGVWMYGTPWHRADGFGEPTKAPLEAVMFLEHGEKNQSVGLTPAAAVAQLLARSFPPVYDPDGMAFTLDLLHRLVQRIPCTRLRFVPDNSVLAFVEGTLRIDVQSEV